MPEPEPEWSWKRKKKPELSINLLAMSSIGDKLVFHCTRVQTLTRIATTGIQELVILHVSPICVSSLLQLAYLYNMSRLLQLAYLYNMSRLLQLAYLYNMSRILQLAYLYNMSRIFSFRLAL